MYCPYCHHYRRAQITCWSRNGLRLDTGYSDSASRSDNSRGENRKASKRVSLAQEGPSELVAATKRLITGDPVNKEARTGVISVTRLLNASTQSTFKMDVRKPITSKGKKKETGNKTSEAIFNALQNHVTKYGLVTELANSSFGLSIGQLGELMM